MHHGLGYFLKLYNNLNIYKNSIKKYPFPNGQNGLPSKPVQLKRLSFNIKRMT